MQTSAEITQSATKSVVDFVARATGTTDLTEQQVKNALYLVIKACDECRYSFNVSMWHKAQPAHSFEALSCSWKGTNHRWPPLTLNLHFSEKSDGTVMIATPEEMPLNKKYFVRRVIEDAACSSDGD